MNFFIDTSSLFKLYHQENGTAEIIQFLTQSGEAHLYISEITKIEFYSTVYKKLRTKEIGAVQAKILIDSFDNDFSKYIVIFLDTNVLKIAQSLFEKYGLKGLRSLDALQLAAAVFVKQSIDIAITSDMLLNDFFKDEGLLTFSK